MEFLVVEILSGHGFCAVIREENSSKLTIGYQRWRELRKKHRVIIMRSKIFMDSFEKSEISEIRFLSL